MKNRLSLFCVCFFLSLASLLFTQENNEISEESNENNSHIESEHPNEESLKEVIFALSATMEGDTTAYYIYKKFKHFNVKFSSIARGISVGDELEYADEVSLGRSIINRLPYDEAK